MRTLTPTRITLYSYPSGIYVLNAHMPSRYWRLLASNCPASNMIALEFDKELSNYTSTEKTGIVALKVLLPFNPEQYQLVANCYKSTNTIYFIPLAMVDNATATASRRRNLFKALDK